MEKKSQKLYPRDHNLLIVQDAWQAHYQILLINLLKIFKKLNVKINKIIKYAKRVELNTKTVTTFLNIQTLKTIE